jgi:hypothetical protein
MKGNFKARSALTLLSDPQIATGGGNLESLQKTTVEQIDLIKRMESESALRAVLVGLALHRIKASLKHGAFGKWQTENLNAKRAQVGYYMRLAIVCLEDAGFSKPETLGLSEIGTDLATSDAASAKRAFKKIQDFVGEKSLNELLVEHGLKSTGAGGGSNSSSGTGGGEDPLLADTATHLMGLRALILDPDQIKRFTASQLKDIEVQLASALDEFRKLKAALRA